MERVRGFTRRLRRVVTPLSNLGITVSAVALMVMMLLVVVDVLLRNTLPGAYVKGSVELAQILLLIVVTGGWAYVGQQKYHIRVTLVLNRLSPVARLAAITVSDLVAIGLMAIVSWQSVTHAQFLSAHGFTTGVLGIPWSPFAIFTSVCSAVFLLALLVDFLDSLAELVAGRIKNWLWLVPGFLLVLALFITSFWPGILAIKIAPPIFGAICLLALFTLIFFGVYLGAAFGVITIWGMSYLVSPGAALTLLGVSVQTVASTYIWTMLPLFMMMGYIISLAAFSRDLYYVGFKWLGRLPGGLASATVAACGAFAAAVGDGVSGVIAFGTIALPEMKTYKYDDKLATGCITAGATLGVLIPPSIAFVIYGIMTDQSIGRLFIAGLLPGILAVILFVLLITFMCWRNPALAPRLTTPVPFKERMLVLAGALPVLVLFLVVIGGIYAGIFTPTEAGAFGAFGALVIALVMRRIKVSQIWDSAIGGARMTVMGFFIFIFAMCMAQFLAVTQLPARLASLVAGAGATQYHVIAAILFFYLILGCLIEATPLLILSLPILYPATVAVGIDPIWLGVLIVIMCEIGCLTPPIGISVFFMAGVARDVPMNSIFKGVLPFWLVFLGEVVILVLFPQIALFLPNLMYGG